MIPAKYTNYVFRFFMALLCLVLCLLVITVFNVGFSRLTYCLFG